MKIIKQGRAHPDWSREITCLHCWAVLEIGRADLHVSVKHDIYGRRSVVATDCGACGKPLKVEDPASPDWGELPEKRR